jgi:hypothetical protein
MATRTLISSKLIRLLLSSKATEAVPGEAQGPSGAQDRAKTRSGLKTFEKNTSFLEVHPGAMWTQKEIERRALKKRQERDSEKRFERRTLKKKSRGGL